jgi:alpha-beta hydrolase superfamily lysophospholipase
LDQASTLRLAVLSLCSATDPLIDPDAVHQFFEALTVQDKQYIVLPLAPHDWILQKNAQDPVYRYLVHWLTAHA